ncbi:hypothetical protein SFRURICE_011584, partial [Spodoptera frugiperda]
MDRPPSQMSYLDQFLKEAPTERHYDNVATINEQKLMYGSQQSAALSGSVELQDELEGPRASSPASSKSSPSEISTVSM